MAEYNVEQDKKLPERSDGQKGEGIITLVLTADNHLGAVASGQRSNKREERLQRLRKAFQQATDFAIAQGVDLFVQAGDLFDTTSPDEYERSFVAERLAQLKQAGIEVFAVGGVHDTPVETRATHGATLPAPQMSYARLGALHYLSTSLESVAQTVEPTFVEIRGTRIGICGLSVAAGQEGDPLEHFRVSDDIERADLALLVLHAPIEGLTLGASLLDTRAVIRRSSIGRQTMFDAILAGYHHNYSRNRFGKADVIVAGATQHIDFSAPDDEPGFVFLGLAADGVRWCNHIAVDAMSLQRLVIRTSELWPTESTQDQSSQQAQSDQPDQTKQAEVQPTERILERLRPLCSPDTMIQLKLEGELTRRHYHQLDLNQIRRYGEEHCFALAIDDTTLSLLPEQEAVVTEMGERFSPREELVTLVDEWLAAASDEKERKALRMTREELLLAMDEGKRSR